jgi:hypothetical protein
MMVEFAWTIGMFSRISIVCVLAVSRGFGKRFALYDHFEKE